MKTTLLTSAVLGLYMAMISADLFAAELPKTSDKLIEKIRFNAPSEIETITPAMLDFPAWVDSANITMPPAASIDEQAMRQQLHASLRNIALIKDSYNTGYLRVTAHFVIEKNHSVDHITLTSSQVMDYSLRHAITKAIQNLKNLIPQGTEGEQVKRSYSLPLKFQISNPI